MSGWDRLGHELDRWTQTDRRATLWWRDDDACRPTPALARLLALARAYPVPLALAAIPAGCEPGLIDAVRDTPGAMLLQHGFAHRNHAPAGARNWELGEHRPADAVLAELATGRDLLQRLAAERHAAVLVPPWNRIAPALVARLPALGFRGLSSFGPRPAQYAVPSLAQCNTHVDLIAWRRGRVFIGDEAAIDRIVAHLEARRSGRVDSAEATGILSHHLDMDAAAFRFLDELFAFTHRHDAVAWLDPENLFPGGASGPKPGGEVAATTSGRSA